MKNKFQIGETVYSKEFPNKKLIINGYVGRVYYCTVYGEQKNHVYFERELMDEIEMKQKLKP